MSWEAPIQTSAPTIYLTALDAPIDSDQLAQLEVRLRKPGPAATQYVSITQRGYKEETPLGRSVRAGDPLPPSATVGLQKGIEVGQGRQRVVVVTRAQSAGGRARDATTAPKAASASIARSTIVKATV